MPKIFAKEFRVRTNDDILWKIIDDETMILNKKTGWYYSLDEVGTQIWRLFHNNKSVLETAEKISSKYSVNLKTAEKDILDLINKLKKENIIAFEAV